MKLKYYEVGKSGRKKEILENEMFKNKDCRYCVETRSGNFFNVTNEIPDGYSVLVGALTAPVGYTWYHNNESYFNGKRRHILVKD